MALLDQFDGDIPNRIDTDTEPMTCIHCGEENWAYNNLNRDGGDPWRELKCASCGTTWDEVLTISYIANIVVPNE